MKTLMIVSCFVFLLSGVRPLNSDMEFSLERVNRSPAILNPPVVDIPVGDSS